MLRRLPSKAMKKRLLVLLLSVLLFAGCAPKFQRLKQYDATFLTLFDTVTTIMGHAQSEEEFREQAQAVHDALLQYHELFDIYHSYEGMNNLKTVNDQAGIAPVVVDQKIIDLLTDCQDYETLTEGRVNVAMGSVLRLWHEARTRGLDDPRSAALPRKEALEAGKAHMALSSLVIDREASTVYLTDPEASLDVGAVAKGWALERVAAQSPAGLLISVGGNVRATGPKDDANTPWVIGVQDPKGVESYLHTLYLTQGSVVTSGDYQRTFTVDGVAYHHIIDPDTAYPSRLWSSVTISCEDSGLADALSTALFLLPQEEGQKLLDKTGAKAMWVAVDGTISYSPGFNEMIRT